MKMKTNINQILTVDDLLESFIGEETAEIYTLSDDCGAISNCLEVEETPAFFTKKEAEQFLSTLKSKVYVQALKDGLIGNGNTILFEIVRTTYTQHWMDVWDVSEENTLKQPYTPAIETELKETA